MSSSLLDVLLALPDEAVPDDVLDATTTRFVDTIGAALSAAATDQGTAATRAFAHGGRQGESTFWAARGARGAATDVALANGMLCHAMDYDDTHTGSVIHPGGVVIPTALAVGEQVGASGREVLVAAAIGYDVAIRLGLAAPGVFQPRGYQGTAILGPFAAATVAARLYGLDVPTTVSAWGLAGSMAAGINQFHYDGTQAKQIHLGWAAQSGIQAVRLATAGGSGPVEVIEGPAGVYATFGGTTELDLSAVIDGLGERFLVTEVAAKPYPVCHCSHAVIDAFFQARDELGLGADAADQIDRVTCLVPDWYVGIILEPQAMRRRPPTTYAARFSLPFAIARSAIDGRFGLDSFSHDLVTDPQALALADRVDYDTMDFPEFPAYFPGGVRVTLRDGTVHESFVRHNRGSATAPLSRDELAVKLSEAADRSVDPSCHPALDRALRGLVDAPNLDPLGEALGGFGAASLSDSFPA